MRKIINSKILCLSVLAALLAGLQTVLAHTITTNNGHQYFSIYFWVEIVILIVTLLSGLKGWLSWIVVAGFFSFEAVYFLKHELPFSPDLFLMLVVSVLRMIVLGMAAVRLIRVI